MEAMMLQAQTEGVPHTAATPPKANTSKYHRRVSRSGLWFVTPFAVLFICGLIIPLLYAVYLSLFREQIIGGDTFVGIANYLRAATDPVLLAGLGRVLVYILIQIPIGLALAILAAVAIDSGRLRFPKLFRLGIFIPFAVPSVVAALMWGYIYGPQFGLVGSVAAFLHVPSPNLLAGNTILGSIANISIWQSTGYNMLIFYASLKSIPAELYEAAELDGAGEWRKLLSIKIPSLRSTMGLVLVFGVIGGIQLFTEPSILQSMAPTVITSGFTPNLYSYNLAFSGNSYNYSAAVAVGLGALTILATVIGQFIIGRVQRRGERIK
jgi:multiple sugar transport system permease protein